MRSRTLSSIAIIAVGLVPIVFGGPVFALLMAGLGVAAYREYLKLATPVRSKTPKRVALGGAGVVAAFAAAGLLAQRDMVFFAILFASVALPFLHDLGTDPRSSRSAIGPIATAGILYIGLPVYAAVTLRSTVGTVDATWLTAAANQFALGSGGAPRGLAWTLLVVLATWIGDSAAYLTGSRFGHRMLAPRISPNKTVEGALGGLAGSIVVGGIAFAGFGLGDWWAGAAAGAIIGVAGQFGDLSESFQKRRAGVKDSGTSIPGHGGILDRIDALLFAFPVGFLLSAVFDRVRV